MLLDGIFIRILLIVKIRKVVNKKGSNYGNNKRKKI